MICYDLFTFYLYSHLHPYLASIPGSLEIQGGIYHLETGRVEFLGRSPRQSEFLTSDSSLPPSLQALPIRTTVHGWMPHPEALKLLKEGNERFAAAWKLDPVWMMG